MMTPSPPSRAMMEDGRLTAPPPLAWRFSRAPTTARRAPHTHHTPVRRRACAARGLSRSLARAARVRSHRSRRRREKDELDRAVEDEGTDEPFPGVTIHALRADLLASANSPQDLILGLFGQNKKERISAARVVATTRIHRAAALARGGYAAPFRSPARPRTTARRAAAPKPRSAPVSRRLAWWFGGAAPRRGTR